jgi:uracil-DNA glycosylase family protein
LRTAAWQAGNEDPTRPINSTARPFLPARPNLESLREAARACRGCPLYKNATQTVFGQGRPSARIVLVGEQPGHEEDRQGTPFVGPAGRVLDEGLRAAGIDREATYVTNVVKHFKWVLRGRRRLHQKPNAAEVSACLPWLEHEIELIEPHVLVCLGATAAQALLGKSFRVTAQRGQLVASPLADRAIATVHPSSILRQRTPEDREREMERFTADLTLVARWLDDTPSPGRRSG